MPTSIILEEKNILRLYNLHFLNICNPFKKTFNLTKVYKKVTDDQAYSVILNKNNLAFKL